MSSISPIPISASINFINAFNDVSSYNPDVKLYIENNVISAQNFNIGGANVISASRQANFRDIEMKDNGGQTTFLAYGDTGNISTNGSLSVDTIIEKTNGKKNDAANILGLGRNTLAKKIKDLGI